MPRLRRTPFVLCLIVAAQAPCANAQATASRSDTNSVPGQRRLGIQAGIGNVLGGIGVSGEYYWLESRLSAVLGLGFLPNTATTPAGGVGVAAAVRGFTAGIKHRGFLELSVSPLELEWTEVPTLPIGVVFTDVTNHYGPGLSVGYHYTAAGGFTVWVAGGVGYAVGPGNVAPLGAVAVGYTWR